LDLSIESEQRNLRGDGLKKYFFLLSLSYLLFSVAAHAYTKNRGQTGNVIKWADATPSVNFVFHGSGDPGEQNAFTQPLTEWSNAQAMSLTYTLGNGTVQDDVNDVYFSTSPSIFGGGGVAAVTNVTYDFSSGKIIEADIIVNQNLTFSTTPGTSNYLGDVLGHEVGHAIGLAHSEVKHSSMFYWLTRGQYTLAHDDKAGAHAMYPIGSSSKGKFSGRVAGGNNIGVFGAHVHAISEKNGQVMASAFSQSDGSYEIDGLPLNDNYFFYVKPMVAKSTMPDFYSDVRSDFCNSNSSYRGAFYQACQASHKGYPQVLELNPSAPSVDAGTMSIRCDLDVPLNYMANKEVLFDVPSVDFFGNPGKTMVGYITPNQIISGSEDRLRLDLRNFSLAGQPNLYLEFKVNYQSLYSVMHLKAQVERNGIGQTIIDQFGSPNATLGSIAVTDADSNPDMNLVGRVALSNTEADNDFELTLIPESFEDWDTSVASFNSEDFYSRKTQFSDELSFYVLTYRIVQNVSGNYNHYAGPTHAAASSNLSCLDAPATYTIVGNVQQSTETTSKPRRASNDDGGFACGSVDTSGGSGGGPTGFISFLLGLVLLAVTKSGSKGRNHLV
tara:strand:+ start:53439 stop:55274 length:1836 start_codon:yes stop_codon:yes gene_type:complete